MLVRIHYTVMNSDGVAYEDALEIQAETVEDIRRIAAKEVAQRNAIDPWSELLEE